MCGIIAILRRPSGRSAPPAPPILEALDRAAGALERAAEHPDASASDVLAEAAGTLHAVNRSLMGTPGVACLLSRPDLQVADAVAARVADLDAQVARLEARLDAGVMTLSPSQLESVNGGLIAVKDAVWAIGKDRVRTARAIAELAWGAGVLGTDDQL